MIPDPANRTVGRLPMWKTAASTVTAGTPLRKIIHEEELSHAWPQPRADAGVCA